MVKSEEIVSKCVAIGKAIISALKTHIEVPVVFTIEDDTYIYSYCPKFGIFAYGDTLEIAKDNLASAISVNIHTLFKENRIKDIFDNQLDSAYLSAYEKIKDRLSLETLEIICAYHYDKDQVETIRGIIKQPQIYDLTEEIKLKIDLIEVKRNIAVA
ncbi:MULTISPECIES: hypothetical protein [Leptospira]|uniref:Uncharacterized protein n=2 Tax=Leptospira kirschneri TaxID=29507 RepID=A0A1T1DJ32_9LEPT|nr:MULTISPECIES: hypothetical protein [Leptospira]EKO58549.1 hypothetical protein LEP1GSC082_1974 [Leptospira kirschneri str. H2]EMJ92301.1 hypothetical protein LEP1GSC198_0728 [Leptospira kirschneri str. JB]EMK03289.1 hypothetical protein LEP1GSC166_0041 [Leptospira kirschneri]KXZ29138.1 hypothetical protein AYB32_10740 [Leptospira kirschneri]KXZ33881.1 hypothetical protein AYB34_09740 [Leptospira sp. ZV016]